MLHAGDGDARDGGWRRRWRNQAIQAATALRARLQAAQPHVRSALQAVAGRLWRARRILAATAGLGILAIALCSGAVVRASQRRLFVVADAPARSVAVVFGAGVWPDGSLTAALADRVDTAVDLYRQGKVKKLLMSGDNSRPGYDEPTAMRGHAIAAGVPAADIALDFAGFRTYDTCYRAAEIFAVRDALLVTQRYHLPRAIFTCRGMDIDAVGVIADRQTYPRLLWYRLREQISRTVAVLEVKVLKRIRWRPRYLGPREPIA